MAKKKDLDLRSLVRPNVRVLAAYEAKEIPVKVKLDANESPFGFSIDKSLLKRIATNRYPDPGAKALRAAYASSIGLKDPSWLLHGNGSDEVIYNMVCTFGGPVLYPVPTFSMYANIAIAIGERAVGVPLRDDFTLDLPAFLKKIKSERPRLIFLASPNNPTGNSFGDEEIIRIIEASDGIVAVDEAYQPFSPKKGFLRYLDKYQNLVVLRTLSKIGLAALRVGFVCARPEILHEVNKVRLPFNLNTLSQAVAVSVLEKPARLNASIKKIASERKRLFKGLSKIKEIKAFPSDANFILFRAAGADGIFKKLLEEGVLVRDLSRAVPGCLRVTVGTEKENDKFLKTLKRALK